MSDIKTTMNFNEYDINDLLEIFDLHEPITEEKLYTLINDFDTRYEDIEEPEYKEFLRSAVDKIKIHFNIEEQVILDSDIEETYQVPLLKGQMNPTLRNIRERNVNIDSRFRPNLSDSTSDFTIDLNEPLQKVTKLTLTNMEIRHSWYTFDEAYGTNYINLDVGNTGSITHSVIIPSGNYSETELITSINGQLATNGLPNLTFTYQTSTGKTVIQNNIGSTVRIVFYDDSNPENSKINNNLGWLLGFQNITTTDYQSKIEYSLLTGNSITGESLVDVYGTRYVLLAIDDFNKNSVSRGLINVYDSKELVTMPSYYTSDLSMADPTFLCNGEKSGLTTAQACTIREIFLQNKSHENRITGLNQSNIFARVQVNITRPYQVIFIANNVLRYNARTYFGPCDISRMKITLYNDRGQVMNLNGQDFSFMMNVEELYQY